MNGTTFEADHQLQTPAAEKHILAKQIWQAQKRKIVERMPMTMAMHRNDFTKSSKAQCRPQSSNAQLRSKAGYCRNSVFFEWADRKRVSFMAIQPIDL
jgi:hypothetical protein